MNPSACLVGTTSRGVVLPLRTMIVVSSSVSKMGCARNAPTCSRVMSFHSSTGQLNALITSFLAMLFRLMPWRIMLRSSIGAFLPSLISRVSRSIARPRCWRKVGYLCLRLI